MSAAATPTSLEIRADRLFTGATDQMIADGVVVIEHGRVVWAGQSADPSRPRGARVEDHGDATLLPGLIDTHVHLTLFADRRSYEAMALEPDEMMALVAARNLGQHLRAGVTTVRDNGSRNRVIFAVREAVHRGYVTGPRVLGAGRPITQTRGHFFWCNGEADGPWEVSREVRRLVGEGADHIKLMASGGGTLGSERDHPSLTVGELQAAVNTAHSLGRLTTAHCHSTEAIRNAIDAGIDCIEHAEFHTAPALRRPALFRTGESPFWHDDMTYEPSLVDEMLRRGIFVSYTPQAGGYEYMLDLRSRAEESSLDPESRQDLDSLERKFAGRVQILSRLVADGMAPQLSISSDAGCFDGSFGKLHLGMGLGVEAGMSPVEVLQSCTSRAARICGIDELVGTLSPGKIADAVVVAGDVSRNLAALASPLAVYQRGALVSGPPPNSKQEGSHHV